MKLRVTMNSIWSLLILLGLAAFLAGAFRVLPMSISLYIVSGVSLALFISLLIADLHPAIRNPVGMPWLSVFRLFGRHKVEFGGHIP